MHEAELANGHPAVRIDLALSIRPVAIMLEYQQLSDDSGDLFGGVKLAHERGQVLEAMIGFGI
ncbi:hypothetical protein BH11MYX2_BH11MYX2_39330 [soil metagenome]